MDLRSSCLTYHDRVPPPEWVAALRAVSPQSETHSWAELRWMPYVQRWFLYEMVPFGQINPFWHELLSGPDTTQDEGSAVTPYQSRMYRERGVHARPMWVIQGHKGGHLYDYDAPTRELMKAMGRPETPPSPGALAYAPFDGRVVRQLVNHSRIAMLRANLSELRHLGSDAGYQAQIRDAKKQARAAMIRFMDAQMDEADDYLTRAVKGGETDAVAVKAEDRDWLRDLELGRQNFVETGHYYAPKQKDRRIWTPT